MKTAKKAMWVACGMALVAACGVPQANASVATYTIGNGGLEPFNISYMKNGSRINESGLAGGIKLSRPVASPHDIPYSLITVCADVGGTVYLGGSYLYSGPTAFSTLTGLNPIWDNPQAIQNAAYIFNHNAGILAVNAEITQSIVTGRAAVQLAVWEALYDTGAGTGSFDLTSGDFTATGGDAVARTLAQTMLNGIPAADSFHYNGDMLVPVTSDGYGGYTYNTSAQEMLLFGPSSGGAEPVPEPAPMLMGGLALMLFGLLGVQSLRKR